MLINVLTPGFTTSNGSAFLFPLIVFKNEIRNAGMDITLVTNGKDKKTTLALLEAINFPFVKKKEKKVIN